MKRDLLFTFLTRVLSIGLGFINSVFLTRLLGVEGKGEMAIFAASLAFFTLIFGMSMQSALIYYGARKELDYSKFLNTLVFYALGVGFFFFLGVHYFHSISDTSIFLHKNRNSLLYEILLCGSLTLMLISNQVKGIFSSLKKFKILNSFQLLNACLGITVYGILYYTNNSFWEIPVSYIFIAYNVIIGIDFIVSIGLLLYYKIYQIVFEFLDFSSVKKLLAFAGLAYLGNLAQFLNYRLDLWFVDIFAGVKDLGIYALGGGLAQMMWILPQSISMVLLPYVAAAGSSEMVNKTLMVGRISMMACFLVAIVSVFIMEDVIVFLYGVPFKESALVFTILLIGTIPFCLSVIYGGFFAGTNRVSINMKAAFIGLVVTIILDVILIPKKGAAGAAIASSFSYLFSTCYLLVKMNKITESLFRDMIIPKAEDFQFFKTNMISFSKKFLG